MSRRGQSSVEPLLAFSAVWLGALGVCSWKFDELLVVVGNTAAAFQDSHWFDDIAALLGGS